MKRIPFIQGQVELALSLSPIANAESHDERQIVVADIGSDHGYLTQSLLDSGIVSRAIVTDIAELPLQNARNTLGTRENVEYRLCSGMEGNFYEADIAVIAGMGGSLIAEIIVSRGKVKDNLIFVLQPMTEWEKVMDCSDLCPLWSAFVSERGKYYRVIVAMLDNHPDAENIKGMLIAGIQKGEFIEIPYIPNYSGDCEFVGDRTEILPKKNVRKALEHMNYMEKKQRSLNLKLKQEEDLERGKRRLALLENAIEMLQKFC